jgi:phosphohistidine phosphatase
MLIYLVQHGKAKTKEEDPNRPLTDQGKKEIEKITSLLKKLNINVESIMHSEKLRAKETAKILAQSINSNKGIQEIPGLLPNDNIIPIATFINQKSNNLMFVGHLPFMDKLASLLIAENENNNVVAFQQGSVVCIEKNEDLQKYSVKWMVTPEIVNDL